MHNSMFLMQICCIQLVSGKGKLKFPQLSPSSQSFSQGEPLSTPMITLVTNALQYYLSLQEVAREESY